MVTADAKMATYHGDNLKHYVLTLMATVELIYSDASIGNAVNIALVKLTVLDENESRDVIHTSASKTLRHFCRWQHMHNEANDSHRYHYDTAILLTREDLCRMPNTCDTLGLAQSGQICDATASCAVIEDNGLSAAFTIAHELGHVLSIPHDDDDKCFKYHRQDQENEDERSKHIMARMLDYTSHPWSWSSCSRHFITQFFDDGNGDCLLDKPSENLLNDILWRASSDHFSIMELRQPGELFDMDLQCQLVFGPTSRICPYMPVCRRLWCTISSEGGGCRTQHMPWADGTTCGQSKWCQRGECVSIDKLDSHPIDGQWGEWKHFEECSRSCGGGIQQSLRECDTPRLPDAIIFWEVMFNQTIVEYGYNLVVVLPIGATNILIEQSGTSSTDDNYLALRAHDLTYLLNGEFVVSMFHKAIRYGGITIEYSGSNQAIERINTSKPLTRPLYVEVSIPLPWTMVLSVGNLSSPEVIFQYSISVERNEYIWRTEDKSSESSTVLQTITSIDAKYVKSITNAITWSDVQSVATTTYLLKESQTSLTSLTISSFISTPFYAITTLSTLSEPSVFPEVMSTESSMISATSERNEVMNVAVNVAKVVSEVKWTFSQWSHCSVSCGNGTQTRGPLCSSKWDQNRVFECSSQSKPSPQILPNQFCDPSTRPKNIRRCKQNTCPFVWQTNHWSQSRSGLETKYLAIGLFFIQSNDYRFAESQSGGWQIAFGEAGDCYSVMHCPQGQFKINLKGTGLSVSPKTKWSVQGSKATKHIDRIDGGQVVTGRCGGYCGRCTPSNGLYLDLYEYL
ncbi:unnamed protein product [Medioppia subpectinata]|uniref:Uncharacterized protein n=1 Tax=Medioppia subpectinata TaxID=1979941 RepID=A0A7R9KBL5_9ACAR|nr:unnamed protein product [Medioppia subpectinata]CAG2100309.1 unnamed protein product [Medioppia subpectinata]